MHRKALRTPSVTAIRQLTTDGRLWAVTSPGCYFRFKLNLKTLRPANDRMSPDDCGWSESACATRARGPAGVTDGAWLSRTLTCASGYGCGVGNSLSHRSHKSAFKRTSASAS